MGAAVGSIYYPIGYALAIHHLGGVSEGWAYFQQTQKAINAFSNQPDFWARISHLSETVASVFENTFHHMLIFQENKPVPGASLKMAILLAVPMVFWLRAEWRGNAPVLLRTFVALVASFFTVALIFGTRLSGHHFAVLLPLAYGGLAMAVSTGYLVSIKWKFTPALLGLPLVVLVGINLAGQVQESRSLRSIRGVGTYSDAINRLASDLDAMPRKPFVYFPDWGLSMPVAFLTGGRIGMDTSENVEAARKLLCAGRDVAVAVINGDRAARIANWQNQLGWNSPTVMAYHQGDGKVVFELATFAGNQNATVCVAG